MTRIALVLRPGAKAGHAASLVVGVEGEVQVDGAMGGSTPYAKHIAETHARVGLCVHAGSSLRLSHCSIDAGHRQTSLFRSPFGRVLHLSL